mmetsp:Transcript_63356/g.182328  ORF Transcript_63356/g.182328 Transcript_63356/m.182328 type:complete len:365 (-) Transcript_63356:382-1476(-)
MASLLVVAAVAASMAAGGAASDRADADEAAAGDVTVVVRSVPHWCHYIPDFALPDECRQDRTWHEVCGHLSEAERNRTVTCIYSEDEALEFAYIASTAFCDDEVLDNWTCGDACDALPRIEDLRHFGDIGTGTKGYVGRIRGHCLLTFRGTMSLQGWRQDLRSVARTFLAGCYANGRRCSVGRGYKTGYDAVSSEIRALLQEIGCSKSSPVRVAGHSLGAAQATLAIFDLLSRGYTVARSYTFGSPIVGDSIFAQAYNKVTRQIPVFRVARADDPVVWMPVSPIFHHVGTEVYYPGGTGRGFRVCDGSGADTECGGSLVLDLPELLAQCVAAQDACGHMRYLKPRMRSLMGPNACRKASTEILP